MVDSDATPKKEAELCNEVVKALSLFQIIRPEDTELAKLVGCATTTGEITIDFGRIGISTSFLSRILHDRADLLVRIFSSISAGVQELWLWEENGIVWLSTVPPCTEVHEVLTKLWNSLDEIKYSLYALYDLEFTYSGSIPIEEALIESLRKDAEVLVKRVKEKLDAVEILCIPELETYNVVKVQLTGIGEVAQKLRECISTSVASIGENSALFVKKIDECLASKREVAISRLKRIVTRNLTADDVTISLYYFLSQLSKSDEKIRLESTKYVLSKIVQQIIGDMGQENIQDKIWGVISAIIGTDEVHSKISRVLRLLEDIGLNESWLGDLNSYLMKGQIPGDLVGNLRYLLEPSLQTLSLLSIFSALFGRVAVLDNRLRDLIDKYNTASARFSLKSLKLGVEPSQGLATYIVELLKLILTIERGGIRIPKTAKLVKIGGIDALEFDGDSIIVSRDFIAVKKPVGKGEEYYVAVRATSIYGRILKQTLALVKELKDLEKSIKIDISKIKKITEDLHQTVLQEIFASKDGKYHLEKCFNEGGRLLICICSKVSGSP